MHMRAWGELTEIEKEYIAKQFYLRDQRSRRDLTNHQDGCSCKYRGLPYHTTCYHRFWTGFLSNFKTKIDLNNFDEAIDAAEYLPILVFNLIQFCTNLDRAKKLMRISKKVYKHLPEKYRNTKEIYEMAIYSYRGSMLRFMPQHLKNDIKFAAKAVRQSVDAIRFFNKKVRSSKTIKKILLKTKIEKIKCRSTFYLLPLEIQKKAGWLHPKMLYFYDLLHKTEIDCPKIALNRLIYDTWLVSSDFICDKLDRMAISEIWHADKIITKKNLEKFGQQLFVIYFFKYLEEHQKQWSAVSDNVTDNKPIITEQNLIIPAILESLSEKVASKALKAKIKYRIKFFLPDHPFLHLGYSQKIKDLQINESYLVDKVANAAADILKNITESNKSIELEVPQIYGTKKYFIEILSHARNPYIRDHFDENMPFGNMPF